VAENRVSTNRDLIVRLEALGMRAYDLQPDFRRAMAGHEVSEFYHDAIHYRAEGNAVAGRILAGYLRLALGATPVEPGH
jgi:hypothetical protein